MRVSSGHLVFELNMGNEDFTDTGSLETEWVSDGIIGMPQT